MPPLVLETVDDLKALVGREIAASEWFPVTRQRIWQFAEATEDRQWVHVDTEGARRESPYGGPIAHGFLTLSLASHLMQQTIHIQRGIRLTINYGLNRVRFPSPVRSGSRIRARFALLSVKETLSALDAVYSVSIEAEGADKPACVAEWVVRYYR